MESNWWHKGKDKDGERSGRGRGRGTPGSSRSRSRSASGSRPQLQKSNAGGSVGSQGRSRAKGTDYVVGHEPWKKPVEIVPASSVVRTEVKPKVVTAADSIKGWSLFRLGETPSHPKPVSSDFNQPVIGPNGLPEIPYLNLTDHVEIMVDLNDAWLHHPRALGLKMMSKILHTKYRESPNPFSDALYFVVNSHGFSAGSTNMPLAYQIVLELRETLMDFEMTNLQKKHLKPDLQFAAFLIGTYQKARDLLKLICEIFRLETIKEQLTLPVKALCRAGSYREACYAATYLNMTTDLDAHHFIIPLILQERESVAYEYLATHVDMQRDLLSFLELVSEEKDTLTALKDYCGAARVTGFKLARFQPKEFNKICSRLRDKYEDCLKLPRDDEPLMVQQIPRVDAIENYIQRLSSVNPKDIQPLMPKLDWKNIMLTDVAPAKPELYDSFDSPPKYTAFQTLTGGSLRTVFKGNNYDYYGEISSSESEYDFEDAIDESYYQVPVYPHNVQWIFNPEGVDVFLKELKAAQVVQKTRSGRWDDFLIVSLAIKWRVVGKTKEGAALLVVGFLTEVFIIDLHSLKDYVYHTISPWQALRVFFFLHPGIVKVGYQHTRLCATLARTHPSWQGIRDDLKMFVDLAVISKRLIIKEKNFFPCTINELDIVYYVSELVRICYGKPLDHSCLMSNWDKRPLPKKEQHHAAVDCLSVFKIVEFMKKRCNELSIDFNDIVVGVMNSHSLPCDNFFTMPGRLKMFPLEGEYERGISPKYVKFVCDYEVQDLGRQLRASGFDCVITRQLHPPERAVKIAQRDERIIITTPEIKAQILGQYPAELIYAVSAPTGLGQLEEVFEYFNFSLSDSNLFTRCQICNSRHFIVVRNETMKRLVKKDKRKACNIPNIRPNICRCIPSCDEHERQFKKWILFNEGRLVADDEMNIRTYTGAPILVNFITPGQLDKIVTFIICDDCGEVYFDESKFGLVVGLRSTTTLPSVRVSSSRPGTSSSRASTATSRASTSVSLSNATPSKEIKYPSRFGFENYEEEYAFALRGGGGPPYSGPGTSASSYSYQETLDSRPSTSRSEQSPNDHPLIQSLPPRSRSQVTFDS